MKARWTARPPRLHVCRLSVGASRTSQPESLMALSTSSSSSGSVFVCETHASDIHAHCGSEGSKWLPRRLHRIRHSGATFLVVGHAQHALRPHV